MDLKTHGTTCSFCLGTSVDYGRGHLEGCPMPGATSEHSVLPGAMKQWLAGQTDACASIHIEIRLGYLHRSYVLGYAVHQVSNTGRGHRVFSSIDDLLTAFEEQRAHSHS